MSLWGHQGVAAAFRGSLDDPKSSMVSLALLSDGGGEQNMQYDEQEEGAAWMRMQAAKELVAACGANCSGLASMAIT